MPQLPGKDIGLILSGPSKSKARVWYWLINLRSQNYIRQVLQGLQPGKTISAFCQETQAELQKRKVKYISAYGLGEGIGLSAQEMPVLSETENSLLKKGMCLAFRLGVEDQSLGAIMLGDTLCLDP